MSVSVLLYSQWRTNPGRPAKLSSAPIHFDIRRVNITILFATVCLRQREINRFGKPNYLLGCSQRFLAAALAISLRLFGLNCSARALPPILPPRLPRMDMTRDNSSLVAFGPSILSVISPINWWAKTFGSEERLGFLAATFLAGLPLLSRFIHPA